GPPYALKVGQYLELPGAKFVADNTGGATQAVAPNAPGPVKKESLAPPPGAKGESTPAAPAHTAGQPTPLAAPAGEAAAKSESVTVAATPPPPRMAWPVTGK